MGQGHSRFRRESRLTTLQMRVSAGRTTRVLWRSGPVHATGRVPGRQSVLRKRPAASASSPSVYRYTAVLRSCGLAPCASNHSMAWCRPGKAAQCRGVKPCASTTLTPRPVPSKSSLGICAVCRGTRPNLSRAVMSAARGQQDGAVVDLRNMQWCAPIATAGLHGGMRVKRPTRRPCRVTLPPRAGASRRSLLWPEHWHPGPARHRSPAGRHRPGSAATAGARALRPVCTAGSGHAPGAAGPLHAAHRASAARRPTRRQTPAGS